MTNNELSRAKKTMRAEIKAKLSSLSVDRRKTGDALFRQIAAIPQLQRANVVGIFVDFQKMYEEYCQIRHSSFIAWDRVHPNQIGATLMAKEFLKYCDFDYNHKF